ncbi:hypothetical protein PYW08_003348 [Mythimna loreyi]|uniref:Uncharacterized protein n=1 Tax=Mythimna loreyi TaxID=667449 RepID=A0ACC2QS20_9NEOP|nr:hypothetical protein PYW08_003348 [Mythimna loreyi]
MSLTLTLTLAADLSEEAVYYTFEGGICEAPCHKRSTTCRTIDGSRSKCSNYESKVLQTGQTTSNIYFPCIKPCDTITKKCNIYHGFEDCHPDDVIYFTKDYTEEVTYCETPCLKYGGTEYRCYDSSKDWARCAPFPNKQKKLMEIFRRINVYGAYTEQGYRRCGQCECSPGVHVKNSNHQNFTKDVTFNEINMTSVMKYYENEFPVHVVRQVNPIHIVNSSETNPILSYNS